jgi:hypothetical protein
VSDKPKHPFQQYQDLTPEEREAKVAKKSANQVMRAKLAAEVLELRVAGKSYEAIGKKFGKNKAWAYTLVRNSMRKIWIEKADALYTVEMLRLDNLHNAWWPKAIGKTKRDGTEIEPDVNAAKVILGISGRRQTWDDSRHARKAKAAMVQLDMSSEERAFYERKLREAKIEFDNAKKLGIKALERTAPKPEGEPVEPEYELLRPGEV